MCRGRVIEAKINRGRKLPVLPDKWIKDNENGSKYIWYMERQRELQVNTTKFAKISAIKKTAEKGDVAHVTCRREKKKSKRGRDSKIQTQSRGGKGKTKLTSYGQMNNIT
jgi:hypothetical protein